ncbi:MAG: hypothetical protein ABI780_02635 [Ardenticatenales bacterium]
MYRAIVAAFYLATCALAVGVAGEPACKQAGCKCVTCDAKCRCESPTAIEAIEDFSTGGPVSPAGVRATADLDPKQHLKNTGGLGPRGPGTGAGLCVFTSCEVAGRWQNIPSLVGLQQYMTTRAGGGWPEKLDEVLAAFTKSTGQALPAYVQHTGGDQAFLELALRTGRMPCVTYAGNDGFYSSTIGHMVDLAALTANEAAIIDNNRPGSWVWMTRAEFLARWRDNNGGWAVVFLDPPPPPYPSPAGRFEQCVDGSCRKLPRVVLPAPTFVPYTPAPASIDEPYQWKGPYADGTNGDWYMLVRGALDVGYFDRRGWHRATRPGFFGADAEGEPPVPPPAIAGATVNYGVDTTRIRGTGKRYFLNGAEVHRAVCFGALGALASLTDDRGLYNLAAVGDASFLGRVNAALKALPDDVKAKLHVQVYQPGHWAAVQFRLPIGVTLRAPDPDGDRTAADIGTIAPDAFNAPALTALLDRAMHPAPAPTPAPSPAPAPSPSPATPSTPSVPPWALALAFALYLFWRK